MMIQTTACLRDASKRAVLEQGLPKGPFYDPYEMHYSLLAVLNLYADPAPKGAESAPRAPSFFAES
jgi:hypothetical protein